MADGRVAQRLVRGIGRYQQRRVRRGHGARCNFEPSCSHFAQDALRTRVLPVALASSMWRIMRCNFLVSARAIDPVRRPGRRGRRPNALPTALASLSIFGLVLLLGTQAVNAQSLNGGCAATVNGRDPKTMTDSNPLVVHKGEEVSVSGSVPASVGTADQITSLTKIKVSIVGGLLEPSYEQHPATGVQWGGSVNVDNYLKWGVGLYKVEGSSSGQPGWSCTGDGYVELRDGSPLGKPVGQAAAGLAVLGAAGAIAAAGMGRKAPENEPAPSAEEITHEFRSDAEKVLGIEDKPPAHDWYLDMGLSAGCAFAVIVGIMIFVAMGDGVIASVPVAAALAGPRTRRVWVRGRPVLGFFSGLVGGLGAAVLLQQYAYWPLTIGTVIVFPILVAVLTALRAWRGRPFKLAEF